MKLFAFAFSLVVPLTAAEPAALSQARALYDGGRYSEAAVAFTALARTDPDNSVLLFHLGKLAIHRRDYPAAVDFLSRAAAKSPRDAAITLWLGNAHAWSASVATGLKDQVGHGRRALALYRRAVELDAESVPARFALMNFYRHVPALLGGGLQRAYEQAHEIARRDELTGAQARALLSLHEKKYATAYDELQGLLARVPEHYGANFLLGRIAVASGTHCEAGRAALRRCLALRPGENDDSHDDVRALLAQLDASNDEATALPMARPDDRRAPNCGSSVTAR